MKVELTAPWLRCDLGEEMQALSWAVNRPGFVRTREIVWREVHNDDLPEGRDVEHWLSGELAKIGADEAVTMLTSRSLEAYTVASAQEGAAEALAVATVGLSNAERVGRREDYTGRDWGTINLAVRLNIGLTPVALVEAMSIAAEARTAAIIDRGFDMPSGERATGTGTDCIVIAAPAGDERFAGLHTDLGVALGAAVYQAVSEGAAGWTPR